MVTEMPENVELLRTMLLQFDRTVPKDSGIKKIFTEEEGDEDSEKSLPHSLAYWKARNKWLTTNEDLKLKHQEYEIQAAHDIAAEFDEYELESEAEWVDSLLEYVFRKYKKARSEQIWQRHK